MPWPVTGAVLATIGARGLRFLVGRPGNIARVERSSRHHAAPAARAALAFAASVVAGAAIFFAGLRLNYIGGGDEGRWQPFVAVSASAWAAIVFAFVLPPARRRWGSVRGAAAGAATAVAACAVAAVSCILTFGFLVLIFGGGD